MSKDNWLEQTPTPTQNAFIRGLIVGLILGVIIGVGFLCITMSIAL